MREDITSQLYLNKSNLFFVKAKKKNNVASRKIQVYSNHHDC
jgi:hypothetical protein